MLVRLKRTQDRLRSSLFFVPMLFVIGGAAGGELMLLADRSINNVPDRLSATVDSARSVLSVIAGATLTFAGVAFSVSLLLISLASSQYSPRVVHGLFRDPFNKRVMGIVIGTFTYCVVVMRAVRGPLEESGKAIVPNISVQVAVVLGVVAILAIVAFISHGAHSMDISKILHRVTEEALDQLRTSRPDTEDDANRLKQEPPPGDGFTVTFDRHGWIQQIDHDALLASLEPESCLLLATVPGYYAIPNTPLCRIWPHPTDEDAIRRAVRAAVVIGETRTMQQDTTYGVRQLVDVALKALSPGINDPTTAQDALFHLGAVMRELLRHGAPARRQVGTDDRVLLLPEAHTREGAIGLAFDEVRIASARQPAVQIYLLEILHLLATSLNAPEHAEATAALRRQADLVLEVSELSELPERDRQRVRSAHRSRFAS